MYEVSNEQVPAAAAAASVQVSMDKEEVSHPLPATHVVVKHTSKPQRPSSAGAAVLVDVTRPASPVAVLPAAHDDNKNSKKDRFLLMVVCVWALANAFSFALEDIGILSKLFMLLTARTTTNCWAVAAVDALLVWVALAATAGLHYMQVASDSIYLAADPGETYFFVDVVAASSCLTLDVVLAGFLLLLCCCRFARRLGLGEHQGDDDVEV